MTYKRFEDLPVWQLSADLAVQIYEFTEDYLEIFRTKASLKSQIERAALSVSNNIAEGFERGTTNQLISFLYTAKASSGEVRSILCVMEKCRAFKHLTSEISNLKLIAENCSKQLFRWSESLQNSEIKGVRHLNDKVREKQEAEALAEAKRKEDEAFWAEIDRLAKESRGF